MKPETPTWAPWILLSPALAGLGMSFAVPAVWLVRLSLYESAAPGAGFYLPDSFTLRHYAAILGDPYFHAVAGATLKLGLAVTVVAMALAYPLAVYLARLGTRARAGALLAVLLPKLSSVLVALYGVVVLLASGGPLNRLLLWSGLVQQPLPMFANLFAVVVGEVLIVAPYPILILFASFQGVDRGLEETAQVLGAGPWRAFYEVPFKLTLPSAALAALVTLVWALGAFTAPVVLGNPELYPVGVEVYARTFEQADWPLGAALAVANLAAVAAVAAAAFLVHGRLERGLGR